MKLPLTIACLSLLAAPAPAREGPAPRYVSMGSSYAAGPGVGLPDRASGACERSLSNFARQVAGLRHLTLVDVACSGAVTDNILSHGQHGFPAQIEAVTPDTQLVSILIGGNDVDYVGELLGLSCRATGGTNCHVVGSAEIERRFAALPSSLDRIIAEVRRRAPRARIVLLGYLPALPSDDPHGCAGLPLPAPDLIGLHMLYKRLVQTIGEAAARNHVGIVPASQVGAGHGVCSPEPFVAGYHPPRSPGWAAPVAYHPNQAGMDRIAAAVNAAIGG